MKQHKTGGLNRLRNNLIIAVTAMALPLPIPLSASAQDNPFDTQGQPSAQNPFDNQGASSNPNPFDTQTSPAASVTPASDGQELIVELHTFKDPGSGNMDSHTALAPVGWNVTGQTVWPSPQVFRGLPSPNISMIAPDGRAVIVAPTFSVKDIIPNPNSNIPISRPAEGTIDNGMMIAYMPADLNQWRMWLERVLPSTHQGATNLQIGQISVIPGLTQMLQQKIAPVLQLQQQNDQQSQAMGIYSRSFGDATFLAVPLTYDLNGQHFEELLMFGVLYFGFDSQFTRSIFWVVEPNLAFRAPAGQLEASLPLLWALASSVQSTPQWRQMLAEHQGKMSQIDAKGAADRSKIIADTNRELRAIADKTYQDRTASIDRTNDKFIKMIREVEDYTVPGSNTKVQLPDNYKYVYTNSSGQYILTNNGQYDPNIDTKRSHYNWQRMSIAQ